VTDTQEGTLVRLRDVTLADADLFDHLMSNEKSDGGYNDFGVPYTPIDREVLAKGPLRNERNGVMFVERVDDGEVVGTIGWRRVSYGPNDESGAWMFGIDIVAAARGNGYGTEAQRLIAEYLFRTTTTNRVEASTDIDNVAEQRSLEKAGYVREGINRGAQFRGGAYHDLVLYAKLRTDPS
jgi:RimJ/RimL family protein N-acetyltransferase